MSDALAVDLEDADLYDEIALLGALMVAARLAERPLSDDAVDRILRDPETVTSR